MCMVYVGCINITHETKTGKHHNTHDKNDGRTTETSFKVVK
jgi:hypothetical protein